MDKLPKGYVSEARLVEIIEELADELGKAPIEVSRADMLKHTKVPERNLRSFGAFSAFKKSHFPPVEKKDLGAIMGAKAQNSRIYQLEKRAGNADLLLKVFREELERALRKHPQKLPRLPKGIKKATKAKAESEVVAVLSDTHFGYSIDPDEIEGNQWDRVIAARRCGLYAQVVGDFKAHRGHKQNLRVCLNGDIIHGLIHLDDANLREYVAQLWEARWYLVSMIRYWQTRFRKITVECQSGNHDRVVHRAPGRARVQKYNSLATGLYLWLRDIFADNPDVTFNISKRPVSRWEVFGHTFALMHGDTDGRISNPAGKLDTNAIAQVTNELALSPQFGGNLNVVILGHHHACTYTWLRNGIDLIVNGNMDGVSPFAASLGYRHNRASQVVFETLPSHPVGDFRAVRLWHADDDPRFEKIVSPAPPFDKV